MKNLLKVGLIVGALAAAGSAGAATYYFDGSGTGTGYGNTRTSGNLTVSGLSNTGAGGMLQNSYVSYYAGYGMGNINRDTTEEGTPSSPTYPDHAVDNSEHQDALLLSFSGGAVNVSGFGLGWAMEDFGGSSGAQADVAVLAFTGSSFYDPLGHSYSYLLSNGWSLIGEYSNVAQYSSQSTGTTVNSSYWMVAAAGGAFGSSLAGYADYFKLKSITATACLPGTPGCRGTPGSGVPEPGSLALAGVALMGLVGTRRKRRT